MSVFCAFIGVIFTITFGNIKYVTQIIKSNYQRFFARFLFGFIRGYNKSVNKYKVELFTQINEVLAANNGEVFEIGGGCGGSLYFYPKDFPVQITVVEPNGFCKQYLEKQLKDYPNVSLKEYINNEGENMKDVPSNSVTCMISTIVLCSVNDQEKVLQEIKRVLVPGGRFFFMEHVAAEKGSWTRFFQELVHTPWAYLGNGCHLTRNTSNVIQQAGFKEVTCKQFYSKAAYIFRLTRPHIFGWATK